MTGTTSCDWKDGNVFSSLVLIHKLVERFGIERKKNALCLWLVVLVPEFPGDIPRHNEIAARNFWAEPEIGNCRSRFSLSKGERMAFCRWTNLWRYRAAAKLGF